AAAAGTRARAARARARGPQRGQGGKRHAEELRRPMTAPNRAPAPWAPALALVLAAAAGAGCPHQLHATRPYPEPTAAELLAVVAARQQAVSSMNARVRATSWLGGERVRATVLMLVDRPGRLRFEA